MTPIRLMMHLVNPGEYTLLHSTYLSPSVHVERIKTQGPKFKRQDFSARAFEHFTVSCFRNFAKAGGGGKVVRTLLCFFVFFFSCGHSHQTRSIRETVWDRMRRGGTHRAVSTTSTLYVCAVADHFSFRPRGHKFKQSE